jgi:hypothetical protein
MIHLMQDSGSSLPFDLKALVGAFPGIMEKSREEWEELLGKSEDPHIEFCRWMAVARTFHQFSAGQPFSHRMEVFLLLTIVCKDEMVGLLPLDFVRVFLSENDVDVILKSYYQYFLSA